MSRFLRSRARGWLRELRPAGKLCQMTEEVLASVIGETVVPLCVCHKLQAENGDTAEVEKPTDVEAAEVVEAECLFRRRFFAH